MKKVWMFLLFITLLASCYKDINLYDEKDYNPKLGVNSFFYTDSVFRVYVYNSALPGEFSAANIVKGATVNIYKDGQFLEQATYKPLTDSIGYYITTVTAQNGHLYTVEISYDGKSIKAEDSLPVEPVFTVEAIDITKKNIYPNIDSTYDIDLSFVLRLTIDNTGNPYYLIGGYTNSQRFSYEDSVYFTTREWMHFDTQPVVPGSNGEYSVVGLPFDEYIMGVLLNPAFVTGDKINIRVSGNVFFSSLDSTSAQLHILVMKMSENMYEFFQSYELYWRSVDNPFVEPVNVRVNVDGGLGIFAGMSIAEDSVKVRF